MRRESPSPDPPSGSFFGLTFGTERGHLYRAVMEGAAYALLHNLDTARDAGACAEELYSVGGAAKSPLWMQIKADVTGRVMHSVNAADATAWGAAALGGAGAGIYRDLAQAAQAALPGTNASYYPRGEYAPRYREGYRVYRELYQRTKELMHAARDIPGEKEEEESGCPL